MREGEIGNNIIKNLTSGVAYDVAVIAKQDGERTPLSSAPTATATPLSSAVAMPGGCTYMRDYCVSAASSAVGELTVSWDSVTGADGYKVFWTNETLGDLKWYGLPHHDVVRGPKLVGADTTSVTLTAADGIVGGAGHHVWVAATKSGLADSLPSPRFNVNVYADRLLLMYLAGYNGDTTAFWTPVADATGYEIYWRKLDESYSDSRKATKSSRAAARHDFGVTGIDPTLEPGTSYVILVKQVGGAYDGRWFEDSRTTLSPPGEVTPTLTGTGTSIVVNWEQPSTHQFLEAFEVSYRQLPDGGWTAFQVAQPPFSLDYQPASTATITDLTLGATYAVRMRAKSKIGWGAWTDPIPQFTLTDGTQPPAAPAGLSAEAGYQNVRLTWNDPANSSITRYEYRQSTATGTWGQWTAISGSSALTTSHTVASLTNGVEYRFRLRAVNSTGNGAVAPAPDASQSYVAARPADPPAAAPVPTLTATSDSITATWQPPAHNGDEIVAYYVFLGLQPHAGHTTWMLEPTPLTHTMTGLTPGATYVLWMQARNAGGWSPKTAPELTITLPLPDPPGPVSAVNVTREDGSLTASWDAVDAATGYHITYSTNGKQSWSLAAYDHASASITFDATNSDTYIVAVRALNAGGGSAWANSAAAGPYTPPLPDPPSAVPAVNVTRADGTLTASWDAPTGATGYHVTYSSNGGQSWSLAAYDHASASITINATNSDTYLVAVRAGNAGGWSGWRNSSPAGPFTPTPTQPPNSVSSVALTRASGTVTATWGAATGATNYHVTYSSNGGQSWSLAAFSHTSTSITFSANDSATYIVGVRAKNAAGGSGWTNSAPIPASNP